MTNLIYGAVDWYRDLMDNRSDPRVKDWPMMASPFPTLFLCVFYAYFSKSIGPRIMQNRKPLNLRKLLVFYNFFQTLFSLWIFYNYLRSGWWGNYSFKCQPVDYTRSPLAMRMANTCWWYYISKFTEFFDTLFFILRSKMEHVSTLHVIHHGCMPFSVWMGMKFAPGGHSTFFALLNSFVHIVMYFYYMVAAMGPKYQKYIWWKKYLTTFQMVQFVAIFTHQFQLLFRDCDYPKGFMIWIGLHGVMFLFLFSDFYKAKYIKRAARKQKADDEYNEKLLQKKPHQNGGSQGCMPVMNDDEEDTLHKAVTTKHLNGYSNGFSNGNGYLKTNGVTTNGTIPSSSTAAVASSSSSSSSSTTASIETNGGIRSRKQQ